MKTLIIIMGQLAALKSTTAKRLANDLDVVCLTKDDLKEVLVDHIGFKTREENLLLSKTTFHLMMALSEIWLSRVESMVLEGNFKMDEYALVIDKAVKVGWHIIPLFLYGDDTILYKRYVERQSTRHKAHTSAGLMTFDAFKESALSYFALTTKYDLIKIDTTQFDDYAYTKLLDEIQKALSRPSE